VRIVWVALAIAFVFLGTLWAVDRGRRWERPRLAGAGFETLRGLTGVRPGSRGILLMPVHPGCPHCLAAWRRLTESCPGEPDCEERVALLVDVPRPSRGALARLRARTIWWDRRGVWRGRWGHRMYGESMRFDGSGSYLGTSPPPLP
jgi:hypothetical protein